MRNRQISVEELLRWRMERAEADAPPPPRAAHLLELVRPWWEAWPDRFKALAERLGRIQVGYAYAMMEPNLGRTGYPVPTLITDSEVETASRVLYLSVRDGRLRIRFQLDVSSQDAQQDYEVTFVSEPGGQPLFLANAVASADNEYRLDADLSEELAESWEALRVTDRMPYRLILRPVTNGR